MREQYSMLRTSPIPQAHARRRWALPLVLALVLVLMTAATALAEDVVEVVTPDDLGMEMGKWHPANERDGGVSQISATEPDDHDGAASLEQMLPATDGNSAKTDFQIFKQEGFGKLNEISMLGFDWYRDSSSTAPGHLTPALRLYVAEPVGENTYDTYLLIWEGVYNGYPSNGPAVPTNTWVSEDVLAGNFWRVPQTVGGVFQGIAYCDANPAECYIYDRGLDDWGFSNQASIVGLEVGLGSGWAGSYHSFADYVRIGFGENSLTYDFELAVTDDTGPLTSDVAVTNAYVGVDATVTATVDDSTTGNSNIAGAEFSLDGGATWTAMAAYDGTFDAPTEDVTGMIAAANLAAPGPLEVCVRGTDADGNVGEPVCVTVEVVEASLGFVTGGGWILDPNAPEGTKNPKVTFGFNAMYAPGTTELHGAVQVNVHTTKLNFHANTITLLTVDPATGTAVIEGTGRIKYPGGPAQYETTFRMEIVDGDPDQIWLEIAAPEGEDTVEGFSTGGLIDLGGGNITLHSEQPTQEDVEEIEAEVQALMAQAEQDASTPDAALQTPQAFMPLLTAR